VSASWENRRHTASKPSIRGDSGSRGTSPVAAGLNPAHDSIVEIQLTAACGAAGDTRSRGTTRGAAVASTTVGGVGSVATAAALLLTCLLG
jgi:hypothetical protein